MKKRKFPKGVEHCSKPIMRYYPFGKRCEQCKVILPDETKMKGYLDGTYGDVFFFRFEKKWYKAPIHIFEVIEGSQVNVFSRVRVFDLSKEGRK